MIRREARLGFAKSPGNPSARPGLGAGIGTDRWESEEDWSWHSFVEASL